MLEKNTLVQYNADEDQLICQGNWNLATIPQLTILFEKIPWPTSGELTINGKDIAKMDSAGAWFINHWQKKLGEKKLSIHLKNFPKEYQTLLSIANLPQQGALNQFEEQPPCFNPLAQLGTKSLQLSQGIFLYLTFIGHLTMEALRISRHPGHLRWRSLASVIYKSGYEALPIIAVLSFMIGIVITYQMGLQLRNYGANIYIIDLLGLSILREFGPLLTAIMVAGRTGSAFTAELGMMKINQEIDALDTIGVTPAELLLLPKIVGLFIALPLITIWANMFGIIGGMIMANNMLHITWHEFLQRFPNVIPLRALLIGLGKAPVFALIIASIGCFQGMRVGGSADSVGRNTTRSVVLAIFFIIVADAIFSVIFSKLKL